MTTILLIIIVVILLVFLAGKLLEDLGGLIALVIAAIAGIKRKMTTRKEKRVMVHCPCSNNFQAEPRKENRWIVQCPKCGQKLRVDTSKNRKNKQ